MAGRIENLKHFSSTYQPKNRRKPAKLKKYIKDNGLSIEDVRLVMKQVLVMSPEDLEFKVKDKETPMMIRLFIRAYLEDFKKGRLENFDKMMDRVFGKATQPMEMSGDLAVTTMTSEERNKKIKELLEKRGDN